MANDSHSMANDHLYTEREAAQVLALSHRTLQDWRITGRGPTFTRLGSAVRYRAGDLKDFISAGVRRSNSEGAQ